MQVNGRIIKQELKEKVEKGAGGDYVHEMVIVTVEVPGPHDFTAKVQHLVAPEDAEKWPLGGIASVAVMLKQQEIPLRGNVTSVTISRADAKAMGAALPAATASIP